MTHIYTIRFQFRTMNNNITGKKLLCQITRCYITSQQLKHVGMTSCAGYQNVPYTKQLTMQIIIALEEGGTQLTFQVDFH
jgi:hypothetical protein